MRPWLLILVCSLATACATTPALWRSPSQEEQDRAALHDREVEALRQRQRVERLRALDQVKQASSLHDVRGCTRLGMATYQYLSDARHAAVKMGGNRILPQHNRSQFPFPYPRGVDDYEVYLCPSAPDTPS